MLRRFLRSTIVLGALLAAYQAYVLLGVPLMEPPLARKLPQEIPDFDGRQPVSKYQLLLANYFPQGHWSQARPPKVIATANEQAMLVFDDYERHESGRVDIERFAMLVFPTPPREGISPPRDAIVLEAPQGAKLQFDNFRPERGQIGQITRGSFPGKITIRSDMRESGPEDDLLVETSDLEMNTKLMFTNAPVRFRMGQNVGGGRELEIRFLAGDQIQSQNAGLKIDGIDSLEIRREVRLRLQLETDSLLPGSDEKRVAGEGEKKPASVAPYEAPKLAKADVNPPVEVTCNGPFTFDFVRYVASVDRDVQLRQLNPTGPSDQLTCNQLDIYFAPKQDAEAPSAPLLDAGKRQQHDLGRLEPAAIVAQGHPVVVISPAQRAEARGDRVHIVLREQRVRIEGAREAVLVSGNNVLRAPLIDYEHPARESGTSIGRFSATGPGTLHFVPDPEKPEQIFRAAWQKSVVLSREKGQPVLALDGRPQFGFAGAGMLSADQVRIYLRELEGKGAAGLPISGKAGKEGALRISPDRLLAIGNVEVVSPQLTGRTQQVTATFNIKPPAAEGSASPAEPTLDLNAGPGEQRFHIDADEMRIEIRLEGQKATPTTLECEGNVSFREVPLVPSAEQPLEIRGGHLVVDQLDQKTPHVTLRGTTPSEKPGEKLAQMIGRGVTMLIDTVEVDGRGNRLWSDGPGKATLLVTRNLEGQASATPFPVDVTWQNGLKFDGQNISIEGNVAIAGMDSRLRCGRLTAKLTEPIKFGETIDQANINLSDIECQGDVLIDNLTRDAVGVTSHERARLARLTINQQTGAISGDGPGVLRSTRFGDGLAAIGIAQNAQATRLVSPPPGASGSKLHFLRVDFNSGLSGNLYTRELTFANRVRTIYGPVDSWEQELDMNQPETWPPDSMTLNCDEMRINEDPVAARALAVANPEGGGRQIGPVQLQARGNVEISGQLPSHGEFTVQAERASFEEYKDAFILEGSTRNPAKLWRRSKTGGDAPPTVARKIRYVRSTNDVKVDDLHYFEFTPRDLESARRPTAPR